MKLYPLALTTAALLLLAACSSHSNRHGPVAMVYSPNGEPLTGGVLGHSPCAEAMEHWFTRVDANHDGFVDHQEFIADARVQFARMDIDHDGYITPDELTEFRAPFQDANSAPVAMPPAAADERGDHRQPPAGAAKGQGGSSSRPGIGADPVMSADTRLDFQVSLDQFMRQAEDVFTRLDTKHDGLLDLPEVKKACPAHGD